MVLFLLQQTNSETVDIIQKLGFPVFVALVIGYLGYRFLIEVWRYVVNKLDEKDTQITKMVDKSGEFREKMLETQNDLSNTQRDIKNVLLTHTTLISDIKHLVNKD